MATTKSLVIFFPLVCLSLSLLHQACYARTYPMSDHLSQAALMPQHSTIEAETRLKTDAQTLSCGGGNDNHKEGNGNHNHGTENHSTQTGGPSNCGETGKSATKMQTKISPQKYSKSLEVGSYNTMGANGRPQEVEDQRSVTFQQREAVVNDESTYPNSSKNGGYKK